ncbi:MAG TPA: hypothetical protein VLQ66_01315, partial [Paenisporosarcina sp.]|nr:hypothetical protein [Paenisporosarcina sp.]
MKKHIALLALLTLVISGCSNNTVASVKEKPANIDYLNDYYSNPQVTDDRTLLKIGQSVSDEKGEATLKAINQVNKTYSDGPIKLTVKDMKLIHLRPDYSLIDYFHVLTQEEEFDFV